MNLHPATKKIIEKFKAAEIHAARSGREVMNTLAEVTRSSSATTSHKVFEELEANVNAILDVMPAYAPPLNVMHQIYSKAEKCLSDQMSADEFKVSISKLADGYKEWSEKARTNISHYGAEIIPSEGEIFTFTLSETVFHTLRRAWRQGKRFKVSVTESRPNRDGIKTAQLLTDEGIRTEVGVDAAIEEMIPNVDAMIVGAEAILTDGSAICKVGTYPSASIAKTCGVPVYILADTKKFCVSSLLGVTLAMDSLKSHEVLPTGLPNGVKVKGHLFDQTPPELITAIVCERGIINPQAVSSVLLKMPISERFGMLLKERGVNLMEKETKYESAP